MRTFFTAAISLLAISYSCGCQKSAVPAGGPRPTSPSPTTSNPATTNAANVPGTGASTASDADQPDDPGMTTKHDKTLKQEEPSGDESSRAAPNEGDAEPPQ